jgi:hypothetical protein
VKFDGVNWTVYNLNWSVYNNIHAFIYAIAMEGGIVRWLGTDLGLFKFDGVNFSYYGFGAVYDIAIDEQGNKWLGTGGGLIKFNERNWPN